MKGKRLECQVNSQLTVQQKTHIWTVIQKWGLAGVWLSGRAPP